MAFKGQAKAFVRTYGFLAAILPYTNAAWEKLSIVVNFLAPRLPAPRVEKQATMKIQLGAPAHPLDSQGAEWCAWGDSNTRPSGS